MDQSDKRALVAEQWHKWQVSIRAYLVAAVSNYHDAEDLLQQVVLVRVENSFEQIGFLTRDRFDDMPGIGEGKVAV